MSLWIVVSWAVSAGLCYRSVAGCERTYVTGVLREIADRYVTQEGGGVVNLGVISPFAPSISRASRSIEMVVPPVHGTGTENIEILGWDEDVPVQPLRVVRGCIEGDDAIVKDGEGITKKSVLAMQMELSMFIRSARGHTSFLSVNYDRRGRYYADPLKVCLRLMYTSTGVRLPRRKQLWLLRAKAQSYRDRFGDDYPIVSPLIAWIFKETETALEFKSWRKYTDRWKNEHLARVRLKNAIHSEPCIERRIVLAEGIGDIVPVPIAVQLECEEMISRGDLSFAELLRSSEHFEPAVESGRLLSDSLADEIPFDTDDLGDFLEILRNPAKGKHKGEVEGLDRPREKAHFESESLFAWEVDDRCLHCSKFKASLENQLDGSGNRLERVLSIGARIRFGPVKPAAGFPLGCLTSLSGRLGAELFGTSSTFSLCAAIASRQLSKGLIGTHGIQEFSDLDHLFLRKSLPYVEAIVLACSDALKDVVEKEPYEFFREHYTKIKGASWVEMKIISHQRYRANLMGSVERAFYESRRAFVKREGNAKPTVVKGRRTVSSRPRAIMMMNDDQLIRQCQITALLAVFNCAVGRRFQKKADKNHEFKDRMQEMLYSGVVVTSLDVSAFEASVTPERRLIERYAMTRLCEIAGFTRTLSALQERWAEQQVLMRAGGLVFRIETRLSGDFETSFGNGMLMLCFQQLFIDMSNDAELCAAVLAAAPT